jgi:hypothetical protein
MPVVFKLVHDGLQHRIFAEIQQAGCAHQRQPAPKDLFNGIVGMPVKMGYRQPVHTGEAKHLLPAHDIAAATCTLVREKQVQQGVE